MNEEVLQELWNNFIGLINTNNIALLSVIITVLIFIISRRSELRYKKHDDKKIQYIKLIAIIEQIFMTTKKDKNNKIILTEALKKQYFDVGASLLLYGSKKLYRQYLFFREFANSPLIKQCKYYNDDLMLYVIADILNTMRKEVGLNNFNNLQSNEALGFFVNDITNNPIASKKTFKARYCIKMIKVELFLINRTNFISTNNIFYKIIKPIGGTFAIIFKHMIMIPFGYFIEKRFPNFAEKCREESKNDK